RCPAGCPAQRAPGRRGAGRNRSRTVAGRPSAVVAAQRHRHFSHRRALSIVVAARTERLLRERVARGRGPADAQPRGQTKGVLTSRRRNLRSQWELLEARRLLSGGQGIKQDDGGVKNSRDDTPSIVVPVGPQTTGDVTSTVGGITVVGPVIPTFEFISGSGDG